MDVYDKLWKEFNKSGSRSASVTDRSYEDEGIAQSPSNTLRANKKQGQIPPRSTRTLLLCVLSVLKVNFLFSIFNLIYCIHYTGLYTRLLYNSDCIIYPII